MFAALFGFPGPGIPFGSPKPPVCTLLAEATTVAGAGLPELRVPTFTSSFGGFGWLVTTTIFVCSRLGWSSTGFASTVRIYAASGFGTRKTCCCLGFNFGGSGSTGLGSGSRTLGLTFWGGGVGGGEIRICVTGCINSTTSNFRAVCIGCGKIRGAKSRKPTVANCPAALRPIRSHRGFRSGRSSKRTETLFLSFASLPAGGVGLLWLGPSPRPRRSSLDFGSRIEGAIQPRCAERLRNSCDEELPILARLTSRGPAVICTKDQFKDRVRGAYWSCPHLIA